MVVFSLSIVIFLALPRSSSVIAFELDAEVFADDLTAGQRRDVLEHCLAAIAKARSLNSSDIQRAAELVDDQRGESFALDIFGDDEQRFAHLGNLFQDRQQVAHVRDLFLVDQDERLVESGFHAVGVGNEVRREIAAVKLHTFDNLEKRVHRLGLFDGDDAVFADLVHRLGDDRADRLVAIGRNGSDLSDRVTRRPAVPIC